MATSQNRSVKTVAIACQGGGAHVAFGAGVLKSLLLSWPSGYRLIGLTGASGGAINAALVWYAMLKNQPQLGAQLLKDFWTDNSANSLADLWVNDATVATVRLSEIVSIPISTTPVFGQLAQTRLRQLIEDHLPFPEIRSLITATSPKLLVSAIDVLSGAFHVFEDAAVTTDALLASAAIPEFFPAVPIRDTNGNVHYFWDGLYSENPPISGLLTGDVSIDRKPDEIWVIQINPEAQSELPTLGADIIDRRNELSGNLSLNQAVASIYFINRWVSTLPPDRFKEIAIRRIALPPTIKLDYASKLDRRPAFIQQLIRHGEQIGEAFLSALPSGNLWVSNSAPNAPVIRKTFVEA